MSDDYSEELRHHPNGKLATKYTWKRVIVAPGRCCAYETAEKYNEDGSLIFFENYFNDQKHGECKYSDKAELWENGILVKTTNNS